MGHSTRTVRAAAFGAGVVISFFSCMALPAIAASKKPAAQAAQPADEASQKQQAAAAARNNYESGIKHYQGGKYPLAVDNLSAALRGGGLASNEMARALYFRGLAYKKQTKPGLAISDLTSALWLKNGLNDTDRASATAERSEAYRMAGLGDGNSGADKVDVANPNPAAAVPVAEAKPSKKSKKGKDAEVAVAPPIPVEPPQVEVTRQAPESEAAQDAARARRLAAAPVDAGGLTSVASATVVGPHASVPASVPAAAAPAQFASAEPVAPIVPMGAPSVAPDAPVLSAAPIDAPPSAPGASNGGSPVGNFFSNLFSGNSTPAPAASEPVTTASTTPQPATSSWSDTTSVAAGNYKAGAPAKAVKQAAAAPAEAGTKGGKYKIHIAAVRSRQEAEAIALKVQSQNGAAFKSRIASVDEAVIGSMGTFYRVRIGSYASAEEPRSVCNTLRSSGFDCLVVTN